MFLQHKQLLLLLGTSGSDRVVVASLGSKLDLIGNSACYLLNLLSIKLDVWQIKRLESTLYNGVREKTKMVVEGVPISRPFGLQSNFDTPRMRGDDRCY
jgi:hypothetical protein